MSRKNPIYLSIFTLLLFLNSPLAQAKIETEPDILIKTTVYKIISAIKESDIKLKKDPKIIHDLVLTHIAPQLDFIAAARWVLGKHWRETDRKQKIRFIKEFRKLLIQFYSAALAEYAFSNDIDHNIMKFLPLREPHDGKDAMVHSIVMPPNSTKKVQVNYHMHKTSKGWKIYDVAVEGISMITTYKSSFAPQLRNVGVEGLTNSLIDRNTRLAAKKVNLQK